VDEVVALPWSTLGSIFLSMCVRYNVGEKDQDNNLANNDPMESDDDDDDDDDDDSTTTWFLTDCERFYFNKFIRILLVSEGVSTKFSNYVLRVC
jgi:hypothetical protein